MLRLSDVQVPAGKPTSDLARLRRCHQATRHRGPVDAFMNRTALVRPGQRERLAGVTHVDGTARVQAVAAGHGAFRNLLEAFAQRSGIPVLLNTSFNLKGQPIIRTASQAVDAFSVLDLDALAVGDIVIVRAGVPAGLTVSSTVTTGGAR